MGTVIELNSLPNEDAMLSRLLIYMKVIKKIHEPKSVSKPLAEALLACKPNRRSIKLEQIFCSVLDTFPEGVVIKDIDVMFNPDYKVDVMRILIAANKLKPISVIWPGRCAEGKLYYSEESLPDYKVFEISDYDIYCVV